MFDWLSGKDAPPACILLSQVDRHAIAADIVEMMKKEVAKDQVRKVYREASRDPKIDGINVVERPAERPEFVVVKERFSEFTEAEQAPEGEIRTSHNRVAASLISPVLLPGDRRWRFRSLTGEFGAPMRDTAFLSRVLDGSLGIPMQAGVTLDVTLEVEEVAREGYWEITSRAVTEVHDWRSAPSQGDLLTSTT